MNKNKFLLVISGVLAGIVQVSIIIAILVLPSIIFGSNAISLFSRSLIKQENSSNGITKNVILGFLKNIQESKNGEHKEIILYNGITVDDGIRSNEEINKKAIEITKNIQNEREKAEVLYNWVGSNIKYDNEKAKKVLDNTDIRNIPKGGAITAFENRTGICFDKACLYVAMARAVNLKVRLIGGQAFDGEQYVGHAWNEVYLNDEKKWINVDTTFYSGGNYFDSNLFNKHKVEEIAGEW